MERSLVLVLLLACSAPSRPAPPAPPGRAPVAPVAPVAPPVASPPLAPAAPQRFAPADPGYGFADPARATKLAAAFPRIDEVVKAELASQGLAGVAFGVVIDGQLAYAKGLGTIDPDHKVTPDADTVFRIGSISKSFTALAILMLRDAGALQLDDPLTRWIPEAQSLVYPTRDAQPITLRHLLVHRSGLPRDGDYSKAASEATFLPQLSGLALENAPNQAFAYSNLGFGLLGIASGHAAKQPLPELLRARVFGPLGMTSTGFDPPSARFAPAYLPDGKVNPVPEALGVVAGAGGIYSTVRDLAKYAALQLSAYPPRSDPDSPVVARATLREAHATGAFSGASVIARAGKRGEPAVALASTTYGFGWQHAVTCAYDDIVEHNGAIESYRAAVRMLVWHGVAVVVLANQSTANTGLIASRIVDELAATGALAPYVRRATASPAFANNVESLVGVMNQWDAAALAKLLARPADPAEQAELATYHQLHGACTKVTPLEVTSPLSGKFAVACERGTFELSAFAAADGRLLGFVGTSRGATPPPEVTAAAKSALALLARWDDAVFTRAFADPKTREARKAAMAALRAEAGTCRARAFVHEGFDWRFEATCDQGPDRRFDLRLAGAKLAAMRTQPLGDSTCPLR
jgi:CubicO group peptidase (beta-lactamase class C family)